MFNLRKNTHVTLEVTYHRGGAVFWQGVSTKHPCAPSVFMLSYVGTKLVSDFGIKKFINPSTALSTKLYSKIARLLQSTDLEGQWHNYVHAINVNWLMEFLR